MPFTLLALLNLFTAVALADGQVAQGRQIFINRCANCHGEAAEGTESGPAILSFLSSHSDADVKRTLQVGFPDKGMPPQQLSPQELGPILSYLRALVPFNQQTKARELPVFSAQAKHDRKPGSKVFAANAPLQIEDYAAMPITGSVEGRGRVDGYLARVNFLRQEPGQKLGEPDSFFVNDLNGSLYRLDGNTKRFETLLEFNGSKDGSGIFRKFIYGSGFATGLISFSFDPDFKNNGKFYTLHTERPAGQSELASNEPSKFVYLGGIHSYKLIDYKPSKSIPTPGHAALETVLVAWTLGKNSKRPLEVSAIELMRVQFNNPIHPIGDMTFNPDARKGDADWRTMYIACGDGGSGESHDASIRQNPQRLDTLVGKILRIIPDADEDKSTSSLSPNGRYRIPKDNPFVGVAGARAEVWAYGLRNPHRLSWGPAPDANGTRKLIADVIGLYTWESVVFIRKGANYGYPLREGNEELGLDNSTHELPKDDRLPIRVNLTKEIGTVVPTYPIILYGHDLDGGDAISNGFLYQGSRIPALKGKYIFADITTGRLWYSNYSDMIEADEKGHGSLAPIYKLNILWKDPKGKQKPYTDMHAVVEQGYHVRGGRQPHLPGQARVSGGRADIRLAEDGSGELYILSKSDGMIRAITGGK